MTTANLLTVSRVALIPIFVLLLLSGYGWWALAVFVLASLTDLLDGYIARKYQQVSNFGKIMDPLADKLLVFSAILIFVQSGQVPAWAALILLGRELAVTSLRAVAAGEGNVIAAGIAGKIKTNVQIVGCCVIMTPVGALELCRGLSAGGLSWMLMLLVTVWSGVDYFVKNRHSLRLKSK